MGNQVQVNVRQIGPPASAEGTARDHRAVMDRPEAKGGKSWRHGGEHLLMALGGCFMSNLLAAVQSREASVSNVNLVISGTLESAPHHFPAIQMDISADHGDNGQIEKLVTIAKRGCIVANTLKDSVKLSIKPD